MTFTQRDLKWAKHYSVNPIGMIGIRRVYETIQRFVGMDEEDIINSTIETAFHYSYTKPPRYSYEEIPYALITLLNGLISKNGSIENFIRHPESEHRFILGFIKSRYQPKDFLFPGVVIPRWAKRGDDEQSAAKKKAHGGYKVEVIDYQEEN